MTVLGIAPRTRFGLLRIASAVFAATLLIVVAGCGGSADTGKGGGDPKSGDKKDPQPGPTPPGPTPPGPTPPVTPPAPTGPVYVAPTDPIQLAADKFLKDLREATITPDRCTLAFLKVIGRPSALVFDDDKKRGYSADEAMKWLKRTGMMFTQIYPATGFAGSGVAVFNGEFSDPTGKKGRFILRLAQEDGNWKTDWLALGTVKSDEPRKPEAADEPFQTFAVQAFVDAIAGATATRDDRIPLLAAVLSPKLKKAWAEPFASDTMNGFDFNRGTLGTKIDAESKGIEAYSFTQVSPGVFKVEITRSGAKKAYTLKLVKGSAPGEWLVDEYTPQ